MANAHNLQLTVGPLLFHWPQAEIVDFYADVADEAPVEHVVVGEITKQRARRGGLASAEIAAQGDDVAGTDQQRQVGHQMDGRHFIAKSHRERRGRGHSAALRWAA